MSTHQLIHEALQKIQHCSHQFLSVDRDKIIQHVINLIEKEGKYAEESPKCIFHIVRNALAWHESEMLNTFFKQNDEFIVIIEKDGKNYHYSAADIYRDAIPLPEIQQGGASA